MNTVSQFIGDEVAVAFTTIAGVTAGFHTAIAVVGQLEGSAETGRYRVLIDDGTYAYFTADDVDTVIDRDMLSNRLPKFMITITIEEGQS